MTAEDFESWMKPIRARAKLLGYALGVIGNTAASVDLLAAPWNAKAAEPAQLVDSVLRRLQAVTAGAALMSRAPGVPGMVPRQKAHGRMCWVIQVAGGPRISLSVMPRNIKEVIR